MKDIMIIKLYVCQISKKKNKKPKHMQLGDKKLISQEINSVSNRKSPCVIRTQDVRITCGNRKAVRIAITSPNRIPFFFKQARYFTQSAME